LKESRINNNLVKKVYIETFGCQMNEHDSERMLYHLEQIGYGQSEKRDDADIIIINTCAVREKAANRLFGHLGNLKPIKEANPGMLICVGGCTAQNIRDQIQKKCPFVDIVFGTHNISELPALIDQRIKGEKGICSVIDDGFDHDLDKVKRISSFQALIPITTGCNNFCSYCIVPYVRGREKSIEPDSIIRSIKEIVSGGVIEVTLLGQNVNSYGKDTDKDINFSNLLESVSDIAGLKRIRFMTSHPKDCSPELIEVVGARDNIVNHFHLPLQAGSNRILEKMNRKYSREQYLDIIDNIRNSIGSSTITSDIIVGFPGEERKDFEDTLDMVKKVRFGRAFTFIYSPREGTDASKMEDTVSLEEKKKWFSELLQVQNQISCEENEKFSGMKVEVLVEGKSHKDDKLLEGRMENNIVINFEGKSDLIGKIVPVKIVRARTFHMMGEL
jgi:tRNA-2-methylthio-N6-dimethylallyladenosine synthase